MLPTQPGGGAPGSAAGPQGARLHNPTEAVPFLHPPAADSRHRVSWYTARGLLPQGLAPCSIAAAYIRTTGRQPARDPERRQYKAYSPLELLAALAELSRTAPPAAPPAPPPPPPRAPQPAAYRCPPAPQWQADPMADVWARALRALQLPSTRMLLSQQTRLLELRQSRYPQAPGELLALVLVADYWLPMVASRRHLIAEALAEVLGVPVAVALIAAAEAGR